VIRSSRPIVAIHITSSIVAVVAIIDSTPAVLLALFRDSLSSSQTLYGVLSFKRRRSGGSLKKNVYRLARLRRHVDRVDRNTTIERQSSLLEMRPFLRWRSCGDIWSGRGADETPYRRRSVRLILSPSFFPSLFLHLPARTQEGARTKKEINRVFFF